jgi:hypothetical protein
VQAIAVKAPAKHSPDEQIQRQVFGHPWNVQTEAMEMLLRLLRDLPGSLAYLRRHAA